jgi:hypothetical protein
MTWLAVALIGATLGDDSDAPSLSTSATYSFAMRRWRALESRLAGRVYLEVYVELGIASRPSLRT